MRKVLVVLALLVATSSWALERPAFDAPRIDWIVYAAAAEDSMFMWQEAYYDVRIDLVECKHALWIAQWDVTEPSEGGKVKWWLVPVAAVAGAFLGAWAVK